MVQQGGVIPVWPCCGGARAARPPDAHQVPGVIPDVALLPVDAVQGEGGALVQRGGVMPVRPCCGGARAARPPDARQVAGVNPDVALLPVDAS